MKNQIDSFLNYKSNSEKEAKESTLYIAVSFLNQTLLRGINIGSSLVVILFLMFASPNQLSAQKFDINSYNVGTSIDTYVTGGGHGTFYTGNVVLFNEKNTFTFGPCIQKRTAKPGGFKIGYTRKLADNNKEEGQSSYKESEVGSLQLNLFTSLQYVERLPLSYAKARIEELTSLTDNVKFSQSKLSTINASFGVEVNVKLSNTLQLKNFIGASVYYHTNYVQGMYMDQMAPALIIGTGINIFNLRAGRIYN